LALALAFVYGAAARPLAAMAAAKLFSVGAQSSGQHPGLPPAALQRISRDLGRELTPKQMLKEMASGSDRSQQAEKALVDYCQAHPSTAEVLHEFGVSRDTLVDLFSKLQLAGAGQWATGHYVAASALAYPESLRFLLESKEKGRNDVEIAYALVTYFERGAPLAENT
jgi:hypothetical protein